MTFEEIIGSEIEILTFKQTARKHDLIQRGVSIVHIIGQQEGKVIFDKPCYLPNNLSDLVDILAHHLSLKPDTNINTVYRYVNDRYTKEVMIPIAVSDVLRSFVKKASKHPVKVLDLDTWGVEPFEVDWLRKHTRKIVANLPNKQSYISDFEKAFPNQPYKVSNGQWGWSFKLFLDKDTSYADCPSTLIALGTNDPFGAGNKALNMDTNVLACSAYIWKLVKDYPEYFSFSE